jgi:hypothetical protein
MLPPINVDSGLYGLNKMAKTVTNSLSDKNIIANTMGELQRELQSGKASAFSKSSSQDTKLDIIGKNHLRNFKNETTQIKLIKQMRTILDPKALGS